MKNKAAMLIFLFGTLLLLGAVYLPVQAQASFLLAEGTPTQTPQPTPAYLPTPTPTPNPLSPETGLPLVVPLLISQHPEDGYGPQIYPSNINPLTGLPVSDPRILQRRPIAVKITNYPRYVRPQAGLSRADIVYEYYMERGIPRFIAIFYGQSVSKIGPVRSGRLFDEHIFRMYQSYFVFGYADVRVKDYFTGLGRAINDRFVLEDNVDHETKCGISLPNRLCRDPELTGYNTMFANTDAIWDYFDENFGTNTQQDLTGMYFSNHVPPSINPATMVKLRYSPSIYHYWEYDPEQRLYLRWQETKGYVDITIETYEPLYDDLTGERLSASNVVVLVVNHKFFAYTEGSEIMGINLNGRGQAFVFRDGFAYPAEWVRPGDGGVLQLYTPEGAPFPLKPGQTWFQVVSQFSQIEQRGQIWRITFETPPTNARIYLLNENASPLEWFFTDQNPGLPMP